MIGREKKRVSHFCNHSQPVEMILVLLEGVFNPRMTSERMEVGQVHDSVHLRLGNHQEVTQLAPPGAVVVRESVLDQELHSERGVGCGLFFHLLHLPPGGRPLFAPNQSFLLWWPAKAERERGITGRNRQLTFSVSGILILLCCQGHLVAKGPHLDRPHFLAGHGSF